MDQEFREMLIKIAEKNNTTPEEVYSEMQKAIEMAFAECDSGARKSWDEMGFKDKCPKPEEFVRMMAGKVAKETTMN